MSAPVAIAFGGSILAPAHPDPHFLADVARMLKAAAQDTPLLVCTGGGYPARQAITLARAAHAQESDLDLIGVQATRLNAQTLLSVLHALGVDANRDIPHTVSDALALASQHRVVVMGGTTPGHSTDYVGAELAVSAGASHFVVATSVDGVYAEDPKQNPDAQRYETLDFENLLAIIEQTEWTTAGAPGVIDGPATIMIATKAMPTRVVLGTDLPAVKKALANEDGPGTSITGSPVVLTQ